jgi:hypothetical protein
MNQLSSRRRRSLLGLLVVVLVGMITLGTVVAAAPTFRFDMVRSTAAEAINCLPKAAAQVKVTELGVVEVLKVEVSNLAPNTTYSFFVLQIPDNPFGISWYNGEIETDAYGAGKQQFIGRFNDETFAIALGSAPAPVVHTEDPFPDVDRNPAFGPIHTFHLGLWFSDPQDAKKAGCTDVVTPFDGDHEAGIQVLSTRNFPPDKGPLLQVAP